MGPERYYLQERGRTTDPFDLDQSWEKRREGWLTRFHRVSKDCQTWSGAETLAEVFRSARAMTANASDTPSSPPIGTWFYIQNTQAAILFGGVV